MPQSMIVATVLAASALLMASQGPANAGRYDKVSASYGNNDAAPDLHGRVSRSYDSDRDRRRHAAQKRHKRDPRNFAYPKSLAYPKSPWGPFAGPPGLF